MHQERFFSVIVVFASMTLNNLGNACIAIHSPPTWPEGKIVEFSSSIFISPVLICSANRTCLKLGVIISACLAKNDTIVWTNVVNFYGKKKWLNEVQCFIVWSRKVIWLWQQPLVQWQKIWQGSFAGWWVFSKPHEITRNRLKNSDIPVFKQRNLSALAVVNAMFLRLTAFVRTRRGRRVILTIVTVAALEMMSYLHRQIRFGSYPHHFRHLNFLNQSEITCVLFLRFLH